MFRKAFNKIRDITPKQRKLVSTCLYGAAETVAIVGLAIYGPNLTPLELGLGIPAVTLWFGTSMHSLYLKVKDCFHESVADEESTIPVNQPLARRSTHAAVSSTLHFSVSSLFAVGEILYLTGIAPPSPSQTSTALSAVKLTATGLWGISGIVMLMAALLQKRKQEDHPDEDIMLLGISADGFTVIDESLFLAAGILLTSAYACNPTSPYKIAATGLWCAAGSIDFISALQKILTKPAAIAEVLPEDSVSNRNDSVIEARCRDVFLEAIETPSTISYDDNHIEVSSAEDTTESSVTPEEDDRYVIEISTAEEYTDQSADCSHGQSYTL